MIDTEQLEQLAAQDSEMPDNLSMPDQLLFLTLRTLYQNYHSGAVNRDRAKREKSRIYVAYNNLKHEYKVVEHHQEINKRLTHNIEDIFKSDCPHCKKLIRIFTGVERKDIPEDIKEVNAWNERLRELVKERSDRCSELASVIDRVRWALEKNDIERVREIINDTCRKRADSNTDVP